MMLLSSTKQRVLVCGDRFWKGGIAPISAVLEKYPAGTVVIHGAAAGADYFAGIAAERLGFEVEPYPADWDKYGRAAGPVRNSLMLSQGRPTEVHAFHNDFEHSKGTKDMVQKARRAGIPVTVHTW